MKNHNNDNQNPFSCGGLYSQPKADTSIFSPSHRHENAVDAECLNQQTSTVTDETLPPYFEGMEYQSEQYRNEEAHDEQPQITSENEQQSAENGGLDEVLPINVRKPFFIMAAVIFVLAAAVIVMGVHIYKDKKNHGKMIEDARKKAVQEYIFGDSSLIDVEEDELISSIIDTEDTFFYTDEESLEVPDVVGIDSDEAYDILSDCGFNVIICDIGSSVKSEYEVVSQEPRAGRYAQEGDVVTIYVK